MRKLMLGGIVGLFMIAISSCGGHGICDAYGGQADYTKEKSDHTQNIELTQELTEATK